MHKIITAALTALSLAACQASAADDEVLASPEAEELKDWTRQLKADDPDTARLLVRECGISGAFGSAESKLETMRCMHRKYDEGMRAS
jgi:hypothetical protein